jgi:hypothetical protein
VQCSLLASCCAAVARCIVALKLYLTHLRDDCMHDCDGCVLSLIHGCAGDGKLMFPLSPNPRILEFLLAVHADLPCYYIALQLLSLGHHHTSHDTHVDSAVETCSFDAFVDRCSSTAVQK